MFAFIRCDRGSEPSDHHSLALLLAPEAGYAHSAYEVADLDALLPPEVKYLRERNWTRSWGIGRHVQGSQIFDYWRDPERFMVEHYADGDVFDNTVPAGWAPLRASGLAQWGPPATKDFLGNKPSPTLVHGDRGPSRGQRDRRRPAEGLHEGDEPMSINVIRSADRWYVDRDGRAVPVQTVAQTTAELWPTGPRSTRRRPPPSRRTRNQ